MSIPPSPPNPHIGLMLAPVSKSPEPYYIASSDDAIKENDYPYNLVHQFSITYYSVNPVKEGEVAKLYSLENELLSSASVISLGPSLSWAGITYYPLMVIFNLAKDLTSRDVRVTVPNELFAPANKDELNFRFGDWADPGSQSQF